MATPPIAFQNLDPITAQLGILIGLIQLGNQPNSYSLNLDWFADPVSSLKTIPGAKNSLLTLLRDLLGKPASTSPDGRAWYPIQQSGALSNFYVVLPKDNSGTTAIVGLGIMNSYTEGEFTITPDLYLPLFSLPISGNPLVLGQPNSPIEVVLNLKDTNERFTSNNVSFDGLSFQGNICFAGTGSSFVLNFLDVQPTNQKATYTTLTDLLNSSATDWLNAVLGRPTVTNWLNQKIGTSNETLGLLLIALGLLKQSGTQYQVGDLSKFTSQTPLQIVETFCFTVLKQLASNTSPLVTVQGGGVYVVGEAVQGGTDYGLRLQIPDIAVPASSENSPQLQLQLGKWLTGEDTAKNPWLKRAAPSLTTPSPGLSVYLVQADSQNTPSFHPKVELVSLGLDYQGGNDTPLIDIQGVKVGGFEPRFFVSIDLDNLNTIPWGVAMRCDRLGLPLGSGLGGATSNNPVAQNLLSSGSGSENEDPQAVNPEFSAAIAYSTTVNFQLYDKDGSATDTVWLPMQRAFGPLHCQKIGVGWQDAKRILSFLYYGGVSLGGLDIELEGLSVGMPLQTPAQLNTYTFDLSGLDIDLQAGPVEISGGLLETHDQENNLVYNGEALIKAGDFTISALGSYTTLSGQPSMFIFAFLNDPLGGPPAFFVTGLCAGFGYNRSLVIPAVDKIQTFPLVAGLSDPSQIGGQNATPAQALAALSTVAPPTRGEDWIAAGVQFTSFELIHSHALAVVEFGKEFEVAILGLSTIQLPAEGTELFTYVEMTLEVVLKPSEGEFSAIAVLTPNSYVLDPACHLTGGFAFCVWFDQNAHAGDFVLTIGGYHPQFKKPAWYPDIPRLGFNWSVSDKITIKGEAYFALTPSCVMGGGGLELLFQDGGLQAWFKAQADFLISWKPFFYSISVGISIGVSYTFHFWFISGTIRVELGAALQLYGPPTAGTVTISLWIITVTVAFGSQNPAPDYIDWPDFQALLPQKPKSPAVAGLRAPQDQSNLAVCTLKVSGGLLRQTSDGIWIVRADEFAFAAETAVPITTKLEFNGQSIPASSTQTIGIRPMGFSQISSSVTIEVTGGSSTTWNSSKSLRDVPEALWGQPIPVGQTPKPEAKLLSSQWMGLNQICFQPTSPSHLIEVNVAQGLGYVSLDPGKDYLPLSASATPVVNLPQSSNQAISIIGNTVNSSAVQTKRTSVFQALASLGIDAGSDGDLTHFANNIGSSYQADPLLGTPEGGTP